MRLEFVGLTLVGKRLEAYVGPVGLIGLAGLDRLKVRGRRVKAYGSSCSRHYGLRFKAKG